MVVYIINFKVPDFNVYTVIDMVFVQGGQIQVIKEVFGHTISKAFIPINEVVDWKVLIVFGKVGKISDRKEIISIVQAIKVFRMDKKG